MEPLRALVLECRHELRPRDVDLPVSVGPGDVRIRVHTVSICGGDVHD